MTTNLAGRSFCALLWLLPLGARAQSAQTPITSVVVYGDRAQITRSQPVDCASGAAVFAGLPSTLDAKTLWGTLERTGAGSVVGVTAVEEPTAPRARAAELQQQIRTLDEKNVEQAALIQAAASVEQKLASMTEHLTAVWGQQAAGAKPPIGSWDAAFDLLRQQGLAAGEKRRKAQARQRELGRQRAQLAGDLQRVEQERRRTTLRVTALLRCTGRQTVQLSYVVPHASWRIAYQARVGQGGRLELLAQALVQQGTGEDWNQTSLSVSTANLQRPNFPPDLGRLRVSSFKPADTRKVLTRRFEQREHLVAGKTKAAGEARLEPGPAAAEPGLAMQLTAAGRISVPADGRQVVVTLERRTAHGSLGLETVPKLFPFVYRRVLLKNPFPFTMLPGQVEIFRDRAFIGRTAVKRCAPGQPIAVALGIENEVQVSRWTKREELEGAGAFGTKKRLHHRYLIEVGNWTTRPQRVRVLENIPVARERTIQVSLADQATPPSDWNREDGVLTWDLQLPARSKKQLTVAFTVSLPEAYQVSGY